MMIFVVNKKAPIKYEGKFDKELETFWWMLIAHIIMSSVQILALFMKRSQHSLFGEFIFINAFSFF